MARDPYRYKCVFGPFTLTVRMLPDLGRLDVRVVARRQGSSLFERALLIPSGTILKLTHSSGEVRFVEVRVFVPRMQYRGRFVAGGVVEII